MIAKAYGWRPDKPDHRDVPFRLALRQQLQAIALPPTADLRAGMPAVYDQGQLGSCTGNAIAAAIEFAIAKEGKGAFMPSRLFIYYNERAIEGTIKSDAGAEIRDGIKSVAAQGACSETDWPYDITRFAVKPGKQCYSDARTDLVGQYASVNQDAQTIKACLASGFPVVFGFSVYESFESDQVAQTGTVSMPGADEQPVGGHAVVACGYDDVMQTFLVRNSWGPSWGMSGYFTLPYDYMLNPDLASDFWQIDTVGATA